MGAGTRTHTSSAVVRASKSRPVRRNHNAPFVPAITLHEVVDDGARAPVRVRDDGRLEAVAERRARHAVDEDRRVALREDKVVHKGRRAEDARAEHVGEAPLAGRRVANRVPLRDFGAVGQPRQLRAPTRALSHHDADDGGDAAALADEGVARAHRAHAHGTRLAIRRERPQRSRRDRSSLRRA